MRKAIPAGTPENHDVLKAMHRCFRESIQIMADACAGADGANRDSRVARRKLGDYGRSRRLATLDLSQPDIPAAVLEGQLREIYGHQGVDAQTAATEQVVVFVERQIGCELTPALRDIFQHGHGTTNGWAATFELLFAAEIKSNEKVQRILMASRANELVALANEQVGHIEAMLDKLDTIERKIEEGFAAQGEKLDRVIAMLEERGDVGAQQIESFRVAADELIRSDHAEDQAAAEEVLEGDPVKAADALMQEVAAGKRRDADRARQAARLYAPFSPIKAMAAYMQATDLEPEDPWSWIELGRLRVHYETLASARTAFQIALQYATADADRSVLHNEFGTLLVAEGHLREARREFEAAFAIDKVLAEGEPDSDRWQIYLAISHNQLGDVEVAAGDLGAARGRYEASLAIREQLAAQEPGNAGWQRDLYVGFDRLGRIAQAEGNPELAITEFQRGEAVMAALAAALPAHPGFARDLLNVRSQLARLLGGQS